MLNTHHGHLITSGLLTTVVVVDGCLRGVCPSSTMSLIPLLSVLPLLATALVAPRPPGQSMPARVGSPVGGRVRNMKIARELDSTRLSHHYRQGKMKDHTVTRAYKLERALHDEHKLSYDPDLFDPPIRVEHLASNEEQGLSALLQFSLFSSNPSSSSLSLGMWHGNGGLPPVARPYVYVSSLARADDALEPRNCNNETSVFCMASLVPFTSDASQAFEVILSDGHMSAAI